MRGVRPFFSYYGAKHRAAPLYPPPKHRTVIEPFAGSAGYATHWFDRSVILSDVDERICGVWEYLIRATEADIRALPVNFVHVDDLAIPQEAKWFLGFWIVKGASYPRKTPANWQKSGKYPLSIWSEQKREQIAAQVPLIRHWRVEQTSYERVTNRKATWFIDPPYVGAVGRHYKYRQIDREALAAWCRSRKGQVIACEAQGATWLPFEALASLSSMSTRHGRRRSEEAVWIGDDSDDERTFGLSQRSFGGAR